LETKLAINVDGVDDAYLLEVHLEIWRKFQRKIFI
jgi:hypothetical protein